jgi:signal transduction histidine kinase
LDDLDLLAAAVTRELDAAARQRASAPEASDALRVAEALATVTETLITWLDSPVLLQRACQVTAEVLSCDATAILVIEGGHEVAAAASFGGSPEERATAEVMRWPLALLAEPLAELARGDFCERRGARLLQASGQSAALRLFTALRRGDRLVGLQVATRYGEERSFADGDRRIAVEISRLISLALDNAQAVEELRRAGRIKSEFVHTVSHDLRVPLATVIGYADLLSEGAFGPLDDQQRPILRRIGDRARGLLELITATLELPGLESGKIDVEIGTFDVAALVEELRSEADDWRLRRDLVLEWSVADGLGAIESDRTKLQVVIKNLVVNALKFTDRGSVRVVVAERDGGIEVSVADTGIGIAPDRLESIFDPFWQADTSSTRRHGGVGLGLYIVRRLVEILGGRISVESTLGSGSIFRVWHPRRVAGPD